MKATRRFWECERSDKLKKKKVYKKQKKTKKNTKNKTTKNNKAKMPPILNKKSHSHTPKHFLVYNGGNFLTEKK